MTSEDESDLPASKYDLMIQLTTGKPQAELKSLPARPLSYSDVASIEESYTKKKGDCEAWIINLFEFGSANVSFSMGGEELSNDSSVMTFALLSGNEWTPFSFGEGHWYRHANYPHNDEIDLDEELAPGSMKRVSDLLEE